jgi:hypothetical protein
MVFETPCFCKLHLNKEEFKVKESLALKIDFQFYIDMIRYSARLVEYKNQ